MNSDDLVLIQEAVQSVLTEYNGAYSGRVSSDGSVHWFSGPGTRRPGSFVKEQEISVLNGLVQGRVARAIADRPAMVAAQPPTPPPEETIAPVFVPTLPAVERTVSPNNAIRYHDVGDNYQGERFYRQETRTGRRYLSQSQYETWQQEQQPVAGEESGTEESQEDVQDAEGAAIGMGANWLTKPMGGAVLGDAMRGSVYGGIASAVTGSMVGGLTNPVHEMLAVALEGGGGTGSGVMRLANGLVGLFTHGIQAAAQIGGTVIGGALGLLLGGVLGGLVATVAGALAGMLGAAFGQVGRTAGELIGGVASVFKDATKSAMEYADAVMHVGAVSGMSLQSANSFLTTMQLAGVNPGAAQGMLSGIGGRQEFRSARFGAWGVGMGNNEAETMLNVSQRMQDMPGYMQPIMAQSLYGAQGAQLLPQLQDPEEIQKIARSTEALMPVTENIKALWKELNVPLRETSLIWLNLKTEFISGFAPLIAAGIENLTRLWGNHKTQIVHFFSELPGIVLDYAAKAADWLYKAFHETLPKLEKFWDSLEEKVKKFADIVKKAMDWIKDNPTLTALIGGAVIGGPAGGVGAAIGANIGGAIGGPGGAMAGGALGMRAGAAMPGIALNAFATVRQIMLIVDALRGLSIAARGAAALSSVAGWFRGIGPAIAGMRGMASVAGWFRSIGPAIAGMRGMASVAGWFRGIGAALGGLTAGMPSLVALLGPAGLIAGIIAAAAGLAGWGSGYFAADKERKATQKSERDQKADHDKRGYNQTAEDIAEELYGEKDLDKLSSQQLSNVNSKYKAQWGHGKKPTDSIRAENDPAYAASQQQTPWGDFFRDMKEELDLGGDDKPLKIEGNVTVENKVSVTPNPDFEIALETYEVQQSWRAIQSTVGG